MSCCVINIRILTSKKNGSGKTSNLVTTIFLGNKEDKWTFRMKCGTLHNLSLYMAPAVKCACIVRTGCRHYSAWAQCSVAEPLDSSTCRVPSSK